MPDKFTKLDIKEVYKKYGKRFDELIAIIGAHDPMQFVGIFIDANEYDLEVKTIIVQLKPKMTEEEVLDLVYGEFTRWFNDAAGPKENYLDLAKDVYQWNQKNSAWLRPE